MLAVLRVLGEPRMAGAAGWAMHTGAGSRASCSLLRNASAGCDIPAAPLLHLQSEGGANCTQGAGPRMARVFLAPTPPPFLTSR